MASSGRPRTSKSPASPCHRAGLPLWEGPDVPPADAWHVLLSTQHLPGADPQNPV